MTALASLENVLFLLRKKNLTVNKVLSPLSRSKKVHGQGGHKSNTYIIVSK